MNDSSDEITPFKTTPSYWGWIFVPLALCTLVALLTYNWQAIPALQAPPEASSNWMGALGDYFAYYGYIWLGLAVWILPALFLLIGVSQIAGHRIRPRRSALGLPGFIIASACLIQALSAHAPRLTPLVAHLNLADAGGVVGALIMTRFLTPLLSDCGASVLMACLGIAAFIFAIGWSEIVHTARRLVHWIFAPRAASSHEPEEELSRADRENARLAALQAKADAKHQRELEKQRAREEKLAAKEAKRQEKIAAREAEEAARRARETDPDIEATRQALLAARQAAARPTASAPRAAAPAAPVPAAAPRGTRTIPEPRTTAPAPAESANEAPSAAEKEDRGPYMLPPIDLLNPLKTSVADHSDVGALSQKLIDTLKLFNIEATLSYTVQGPVVTKYAILLAPGTRYSSVSNISDNLKGALHAKSLRIETPIPGKEEIGIEVPNRAPAGISFREIFETPEWQNSKAELPLLFGRRADGEVLLADLASMPHMLVAGATGQGKSVCLNSLICGLLMTRTPEQLKLIMVDPKSVEFTPYAAIPHLLVPVITDNRKVVFSLHWAVAEMEKRLKLFARARVKNIYDFNHRKLFTQTDMFGEESDLNAEMPRTVPYIVIIIDEAADLIGQCGKDVNPDIQRLTQKARAAGIHLILATQRPEAKIITGAIKANIPGRVAFKTSSALDSRTILDDSGAENLIGKGDMLFRGKDNLLVRAQGAWIADEEIMAVTSFIEAHAATQFDEKFATKLGRVKEATITDPFADNQDDPDNQPQNEAPQASASTRELAKAAALEDDFKAAIQCIINTNRASTSHFQRQMGWGYNHAAKVLDQLTERGVVSPQQGMGARSIVMSQDQLAALLNNAEVLPDAPAADEATQADNAALDDNLSETTLTNDTLSETEELKP